MDLIKNNELIAEFMGLQKSKPAIQQFINEPEKNGLYYERENGVHEYLSYHKSWDWLMPVVDKLEQLKHPVHIINNNCYIYYSTNAIKNEEFFVDIYGENKMDAVYRAVVTFIQYLNT
jgi:hypothetical protein